MTRSPDRCVLRILGKKSNQDAPTILTIIADLHFLQMFDSSLCDRTLNTVPLFIPWWQFPWLKNFLLISLVVFLLLGLVLLFRQAKRKHWLRKPKVLIGLFCLSAVFPLSFWLFDKFLVTFIPKDSGETAGAIVLLGRGGGDFYTSRTNLAKYLWETKRAPLIFTSGIDDAPSMISQLQEKGVPRQALDGENCSLTTAENALFSAAVLQPRGIKKIILITDEPHLWRSLLVFRANGFEVIPRSTPLPSYLGTQASFILKLREYGGLLTYTFRGILSSTPAEAELDSPGLAKAVQAAQAYGKQQSLPSVQ
ncbi:MAG: YdcF family protein [Coleofasciculaceae cyanobacterium]